MLLRGELGGKKAPSGSSGEKKILSRLNGSSRGYAEQVLEGFTGPKLGIWKCTAAKMAVSLRVGGRRFALDTSPPFPSVPLRVGGRPVATRVFLP